MGLTPKRELQRRNEGWKDIDDRLQATIKFEGDSSTIKLSDYPSLTKEEIIAEAEKNNYNVVDDGNGFLHFS